LDMGDCREYILRSHIGGRPLKHQEAKLDFSSNTLLLAQKPFPLIFNDRLPPATTAISCPLLTLIEEYAHIFFIEGEPIKTISKHANPLLRWTVDNQYICIECEGIGHIGKDCNVRRWRLEREQGLAANPNQFSGN
jgi:hypothetical protein